MVQSIIRRRWITRDSAAPLENTQYSRAGLVAGNVMLFGPILLTLAPQSLGVLSILAIIAAAPWRAVSRRRTPALHTWLVIAFLVWGGARMALGPMPDRALMLELLSAITIMGMGLLVGGDVRRAVDRGLVTRAAIAGISIAVLFLAIDAYLGWQLLGQLSGEGEFVSSDPTLSAPASRTGLIAISALIPLVFAGASFSLRIGLWGWIGAAAAVLSILGLCLFVGHWLGVLAWVMGAAMLGAGHFRPERAFSTIALFGACAVALSPWWIALSAGFVAQSFAGSLSADAAFAWVARVQTWTFAADLAWQKPIEGWGFGAAATFEDTYQLRGYSVPYIPGHPHSAALQLWLELGGVGVALACGTLAALGRRSGAALAKDMFAAAAASSALAAGLAMACFDAELWNPSLWTALSLSAVMTRLFRDAS